MEKEYSNEIRGKVHAYRFTDFEKSTIAAALLPVVKKWQAKIKKVENHPKNEGQATYLCQIDQLDAEMKGFQEIIDEFTK